MLHRTVKAMHSRNKGDTIIEVILAVTVFSLVAVGAMTIMSSGISRAQRTLEITQVRHQIDAQAEMLRYIRDRSSEDGDYATLWGDITSTSRVVANPVSVLNADSCPDASDLGSSSMFSLRPASGGTVGIWGSDRYKHEPDTYAKVTDTESQGISIQVTEAEGGGAYDAYVQACWYGPGSSRPATIGTIVRLYATN